MWFQCFLFPPSPNNVYYTFDSGVLCPFSLPSSAPSGFDLLPTRSSNSPRQEGHGFYLRAEFVKDFPPYPFTVPKIVLSEERSFFPHPISWRCLEVWLRQSLMYDLKKDSRPVDEKPPPPDLGAFMFKARFSSFSMVFMSTHALPPLRISSPILPYAVAGHLFLLRLVRVFFPHQCVGPFVYSENGVRSVMSPPLSRVYADAPSPPAASGFCT